MSAVTDMERAVERLSQQDSTAFRAWLAERDATVWNRQLKADVADGRLDVLTEEALREMRTGRYTET